MNRKIFCPHFLVSHECHLIFRRYEGGGEILWKELHTQKEQKTDNFVGSTHVESRCVLRLITRERGEYFLIFKVFLNRGENLL